METLKGWEIAHAAARSFPSSPNEIRLVVLLDAIERSHNAHLMAGGRFPDSEATPAYGQILQGTLELLNQTLDRLDAGKLYAEIETIADLIGWDLEESAPRG